jgi:hypothetical protein
MHIAQIYDEGYKDLDIDYRLTGTAAEFNQILDWINELGWVPSLRSNKMTSRFGGSEKYNHVENGVKIIGTISRGPGLDLALIDVLFFDQPQKAILFKIRWITG